MEQAKPYGTVLIKAAKIIDCIAENPHIGLQEIAHQCQMTMPNNFKNFRYIKFNRLCQKKRRKKPIN